MMCFTEHMDKDWPKDDGIMKGGAPADKNLFELDTDAYYKHCMECGIVRCEKRAQLIDIYCDTCPDYPCEEVLEKQTRYTSAYPMYESPMGNLQILRTRGMDALLEREEKYWTCPECSGKISVHDGVCEKCGKKYRKTPVPEKDV